MNKKVRKSIPQKKIVEKTVDASWVTKAEFQKHEETMSTMFGHVMERFESHDQQFVSISQRFKSIDQKFEVIDQRFEAIDQRFDSMDRRFDNIDQQLILMNHQFFLMNQQFKEMRDERTTIYASLFKNEHDIARVHERIQVLELKG